MLTWIGFWYFLAALCAFAATIRICTKWIELVAAAIFFLILAQAAPIFSALIPG